MFDTEKSSTYISYNQTFSIAFATGGGVNPVISADEYVLTMLAGEDTITVGGIATPNVSLYTVINQTEAFASDPYSGIQGSAPLSASGHARSCTVRDVNAGPRVLRRAGSAGLAW